MKAGVAIATPACYFGLLRLRPVSHLGRLGYLDVRSLRLVGYRLSHLQLALLHGFLLSAGDVSGMGLKRCGLRAPERAEQMTRGPSIGLRRLPPSGAGQERGVETKRWRFSIHFRLVLAASAPEKTPWPHETRAQRVKLLCLAHQNAAGKLKGKV